MFIEWNKSGGCVNVWHSSSGDSGGGGGIVWHTNWKLHSIRLHTRFKQSKLIESSVLDLLKMIVFVIFAVEIVKRTQSVSPSVRQSVNCTVVIFVYFYDFVIVIRARASEIFTHVHIILFDWHVQCTQYTPILSRPHTKPNQFIWFCEHTCIWFSSLTTVTTTTRAAEAKYSKVSQRKKREILNIIEFQVANCVFLPHLSVYFVKTDRT